MKKVQQRRKEAKILHLGRLQQKRKEAKSGHIVSDREREYMFRTPV